MVIRQRLLPFFLSGLSACAATNAAVVRVGGLAQLFEKVGKKKKKKRYATTTPNVDPAAVALQKPGKAPAAIGEDGESRGRRRGGLDPEKRIALWHTRAGNFYYFCLGGRTPGTACFI